MALANKKTDTLINGKTLWEFVEEIKNTVRTMTQKERSNYMNRILENKDLLEQIERLYELADAELIKEDYLHDKTDIGRFFDALASLILYAPNSEGDMNIVSSWDEMNGFKDLEYKDELANDNKGMFKNSSMKINENEIYNDNFADKMTSRLDKDNIHKRDSLKELYTEYQQVLRQMQHGNDIWKILQYDKIKTKSSLFEIKYNKKHNDFELYNVETKELVMLDKYLYYIENHINIINKNENYQYFLKHIYTTNLSIKDMVNVNTYRKLLRKNNYDFVYFKVEKIYKDFKIKTKVDKILTQINGDMITAKRCFFQPIPRSHDRSFLEAPVKNYEWIDFLNKEHIEGLLRVEYSVYDKMFSKNKDYYDELDFKNILYNFNNIVKKCEFNHKQTQILELLRKDNSLAEISRILDLPYTNIFSTYEVIVNKVCDSACDFCEDMYYLYTVKGTYKTCTKCNEVKLISRFYLEKNGKFGCSSVCKTCKNDKI